MQAGRPGVGWGGLELELELELLVAPQHRAESGVLSLCAFVSHFDLFVFFVQRRTKRKQPGLKCPVGDLSP